MSITGDEINIGSTKIILKNNQIIEFNDSNITNIGFGFLHSNRTLVNIELPNGIKLGVVNIEDNQLQKILRMCCDVVNG